MHGRQVLRGAGGQRAIEVAQRPGRGQRPGAFDQCSFELTSHVVLELAQPVARHRFRVPSTFGQLGAGQLALEAERAPDALHVDPDHARALALATEGGDRQPGQIAQVTVRAPGGAQRVADALAQRVEIDGRIVTLTAAALPDSALHRLALHCAEEEAVEDQPEQAPVLL